MDDPRLKGLVGITLHRRPYFLWSPEWDHDECEICGVVFEVPGREPRTDSVVTSGWTTDDEYTWVCDLCFSARRDAFGWQTREVLPTDHPGTPWPAGDML